ncbi:MAG: SDR family NAD(P)-dependent oxidoreductase [Chloroflexia bacterium]|nr:SDR family NAD(P)-dependent oxidoreductase [Chloroflexia bacterium]
MRKVRLLVVVGEEAGMHRLDLGPAPKVDSEVRVTYSDAEGGPLFVDVVRPPATDQLHPAVVLFPGWGESRYARATEAQDLAQAGYVAVMVDYRMDWPEFIDDAQLAVRWVRANADRYGIDPERICAYGHSAGGQLAAMLAVRDALHEHLHLTGTKYEISKEHPMTQPTRTVLMTGATRGIGRAAAIHMLRDAPDLHLAVLARGDGQRVVDDLTAASGNTSVSAVAGDLASLGCVRAAAATLRSRLEDGTLPPLRGIVGNAGIQRRASKQPTVDGLEPTFAVNVLAHHLLIRELADLLRAPARIVLTTSDTHFGDFKHTAGLIPAPRWSSAERLASSTEPGGMGGGLDGPTAYSTSKLGVVSLVHALAGRLPAGVDVYSFNPSLVPGTDLARDGGRFGAFVFKSIMPRLTFLMPFTSSVDDAGANLAAAAIGPTPGESGSYINKTRTERSSDESYNPDREAELWETADRLTGGAARAGPRSTSLGCCGEA